MPPSAIVYRSGSDAAQRGDRGGEAVDQTTRQQWQDWVTREIGGSAARIRAATDAAIAAIARGESSEEAAAAARATTITVSADSALAKHADSALVQPDDNASTKPADGLPAAPADNDAAARRELLARVRARRASVHAFVQDQRPRGARLTTASMACSGLVTALTAGPAFGGPKFTQIAQQTFNLPSEAFVWRFLCFAAVLASVAAGITTNMYKTQDLGARLVKAEASQGVLEGVEVLLEFGQVPVADAIKLYQQAIAEIPFIPDQAATAR